MDAKRLTLKSGNVELSRLPLKCVYLHNIKGLRSLKRQPLEHTVSSEVSVFKFGYMSFKCCFFSCLTFHEYANTLRSDWVNEAIADRTN